MKTITYDPDQWAFIKWPPTEKMLDAAFNLGHEDQDGLHVYADPESSIKAMIAASPQPLTVDRTISNDEILASFDKLRGNVLTVELGTNAVTCVNDANILSSVRAVEARIRGTV